MRSTSQETDSVRSLMRHAWDNVETVRAVARAQYYDVGEDAQPSRHPFWRFLDPTALFAFDNQPEPWRLRAWWKSPDAWRYAERSPAGTEEEYVAVGHHWTYRMNGQQMAYGVFPVKELPLVLSVGSPQWTAYENCQRVGWLNPALWVDSMSLTVLEHARIQDYEVFHVLAYPDPDALRTQRGLFDPTQDLEWVTAGHVFQLWVNAYTGFFRRLSAEADNGRAWDILIDILEINQPLDGGIF
ncbi:hypothetical protein [Sulfobacillus thermosulfidooxidans]|uniref:hypothetical protein n=1 Tax=Sulfobacillus thermosulfidooxidans TaxID=28034 RepID=UPI0006B4B06C|nr:hypothetical protein [Sulfobacillus thermosulfidooxidans]